MAEAHQAVPYSKLIKHDHTERNRDNEAFQHVLKFGSKSWKKRLARINRKIRNAVYPVHVETFWMISMLVIALFFASKKVPFDLVNVVASHLPGSTFGWQIAACFIVGFFIWLLICIIMRLMLKSLLTYRGFLNEPRRKGVSLKTKIWGIMLATIIKLNKPKLYSFQATLPPLPLPRLEDTVEQYLRSVRPLFDDVNYDRISKDAQEFQSGVGKKLQRYLFFKSLWSTNYVSDWWEEYIYLRGRAPLMVNSNCHSYDVIKTPVSNQTARAASLIYEMLKFREKLDSEDLTPIMIQGLVPLCSNQYKRMYNTARVPGIETDKIDHYEDIDHIIVLCNGCYYKVIIEQRQRLLNPCEIQHQLEHILKNKEIPSNGEKYLGSLTAWDRTNWAKAREKYFASGINKISLKLIESAAIFLVLHDKPLEFDTNIGSEKMRYYSNQIIHGNIYDRWFDKNFQFIIGTNGRYGLNFEHAWADAPIIGHMLEDIHLEDMKNYDEKGNLRGKIQIEPPTPTRLQWSFNDELLGTIDIAYNDALKLATDVDCFLLFHTAFGKGLIKTCHLSPDAFIQMALQLAYYRDYGKFSLTYEATMTRLYLEGRTETVRPCTIESCAWVKAMEDKNSNTDERVRLLQVACQQHQVGYLNSMCGRGIDRHLFCLYVVSKYLQVNSPFLTEAVSEPWRFSTSQTPYGQTPRIDLKKIPQLLGAGGGFGPATPDGYGISYIIAGENDIFFHISSVKSNDVTNTERFANRIVKAMNDVKSLYEEYNVKIK